MESLELSRLCGYIARSQTLGLDDRRIKATR